MTIITARIDESKEQEMIDLMNYFKLKKSYFVKIWIDLVINDLKKKKLEIEAEKIANDEDFMKENMDLSEEWLWDYLEIIKY